MDGLIAYGGIVIAVAIFAIQYTFDDLQKGVSFLDASENYEQNDDTHWQLRLLGNYYVQRARRREIPDFAPRSFFALQLFTASFWTGLYSCYAFMKAQSGDYILEAINATAAGIFALFVILTWWRQGRAHAFYLIVESTKNESYFRRKFGLSVEMMMLVVFAGVFLGVALAWYFTQWSLLPGAILLATSTFWRAALENQFVRHHEVKNK